MTYRCKPALPLPPPFAGQVPVIDDYRADASVGMRSAAGFCYHKGKGGNKTVTKKHPKSQEVR